MKRSKESTLSNIDNLAEMMDCRFQEKMKFANDFLNKYYAQSLDCTWIWIGFVRPKTLSFFIYAIISEYEAAQGDKGLVSSQYLNDERNS